MQRSRTKNSIKLANMVVHKPSAPSEYTLQKNVEFNGKIYSYIQNFNQLSQKEQDELKECGWFQAGLPREVSLEILLQPNVPAGSFLVRQSESNKNCFALSMRLPNIGSKPKLAHYLIENSHNGYRFRGFPKEFPSIKSLIVHHSIIKGHLPVPLLLLSRAQDFAMRNLRIEESSESESDDLKEEKSNKSTSCFCKN